MKRTFKRICLKYENLVWETSYFRYLNKTHEGVWNCKNLNEKNLDGNTLKMKATSPINVIKIKIQCFQLFLSQFLRDRFVRVRARSGTQVKLRIMKLIFPGLAFYITIFLFTRTPLKSCFAMFFLALHYSLVVYCLFHFNRKLKKENYLGGIRIMYFNMKRDGNFKRNLTDGNQKMYFKSYLMLQFSLLEDFTDKRFLGGEHLTSSSTKTSQTTNFKLCTHISNRLLPKRVSFVFSDNDLLTMIRRVLIAYFA